MQHIKTLLCRSAVLSLLVCAAGCTSVQPWVKPYERQNLADPIMSFEPHQVSTRYINHVYEAREAARGAEGSAGGGCGCN
ncbi:MAG: DUF4266 domain-containing protein [Cellvibrionaceae bacterium]|nr:DUF4266 domain-containing protein [Cellvibrionaceae bacterium]